MWHANSWRQLRREHLRPAGAHGGEYKDHVAVLPLACEDGEEGRLEATFHGFAQYGYDGFDYRAEDAWLATNSSTV